MIKATNSDLLANFKLLGLKVKDPVTGLKGVCTSICFDLNGCIQGLLTRGVDKEGKCLESLWVDLKRLQKDGKQEGPLAPLPDFLDVQGPEAKPGLTSKPVS